MTAHLFRFVKGGLVMGEEHTEFDVGGLGATEKPKKRKMRYNTALTAFAHA